MKFLESNDKPGMKPYYQIVNFKIWSSTNSIVHVSVVKRPCGVIKSWIQ